MDKCLHFGVPCRKSLMLKPNSDKMPKKYAKKEWTPFFNKFSMDRTNNSGRKISFGLGENTQMVACRSRIQKKIFFLTFWGKHDTIWWIMDSYVRLDAGRWPWSDAWKKHVMKSAPVHFLIVRNRHWLGPSSFMPPSHPPSLGRGPLRPVTVRLEERNHERRGAWDTFSEVFHAPISFEGITWIFSSSSTFFSIPLAIFHKMGYNIKDSI